MVRTRSTTRGGWRAWLGLLLVGVLGLQGCQSAGSRTAADLRPASGLDHASAPLLPSQALGLRPGRALGVDLSWHHASSGLTPVCCDFGVGIGRGDACVLIGLLVLTAPVWITCLVIASPLLLLGS